MADEARRCRQAIDRLDGGLRQRGVVELHVVEQTGEPLAGGWRGIVAGRADIVVAHCGVGIRGTGAGDPRDESAVLIERHRIVGAHHRGDVRPLADGNREGVRCGALIVEAAIRGELQFASDDAEAVAHAWRAGQLAEHALRDAGGGDVRIDPGGDGEVVRHFECLGAAEEDFVGRAVEVGGGAGVGRCAWQTDHRSADSAGGTIRAVEFARTIVLSRGIA